MKKVLLILISTAIQIAFKPMVQCVMDMVNVIVVNVYVMINMLGHIVDVWKVNAQKVLVAKYVVVMESVFAKGILLLQNVNAILDGMVIIAKVR